MTIIIPDIKQSLIVFGAFIFTASITFGTLTVSQDTSQNYLRSTPYYSDLTMKDTTRDNYLRSQAPKIVDRLDEIIKTHIDQAIVIKNQPGKGQAEANRYLEYYLLKLSKLEEKLIQNPAYQSTFSYIFTYIAPRIRLEIKIIPSFISTISGENNSQSTISGETNSLDTLSGENNSQSTISGENTSSGVQNSIVCPEYYTQSGDQCIDMFGQFQ